MPDGTSDQPVDLTGSTPPISVTSKPALIDLPVKSAPNIGPGLGTSPVSTVTAPSPGLTPPTVTVPSHVAAGMADHASKWQAVKHLATSVFGDNGQPPKPGQLFRNILFGALAGGAAASEAHARNPQMGGFEGAMIGGQASVEDQRKRTQLIQAQKQQQFENKLKQQKEQREEQAEQREELNAKAQRALWNTQQIVALHNLAGSDLERHIKQVELDKPAYDALVTAGAVAGPRDLPESEATAMDKARLQDHLGKYRWFVTGHIMKGIDPDTKMPIYENTVSAIGDPSQPVTITQPLLDQWKDLLGDQYADLAKVVKVGQKRSADEVVTLMQLAKEAYNNRMLSRTADAALKEKEAQAQNYLAEAKARPVEAQARLTEARARSAEAAATVEEKKEGKTRAEQLGNARKAWNDKLHELQKKNPDATLKDAFAQLDPGVQDVITTEYPKEIFEESEAIAKLPKDDLGEKIKPEYQEAATELAKDIEGKAALLNIARGVKEAKQPTGSSPVVQQAADMLKGLSKEDQQENIHNNIPDPATRDTVRKILGLPDVYGDGLTKQTQQPTQPRTIGMGIGGSLR